MLWILLAFIAGCAGGFGIAQFKAAKEAAAPIDAEAQRLSNVAEKAAAGLKSNA